MLELPVLTCKKEAEGSFSVGASYEVQAYVEKALEEPNFNEPEVMVIDDVNDHHYMSMDWLSEHFDLEGDLNLMLEVY